MLSWIYSRAAEVVRPTSRVAIVKNNTVVAATSTIRSITSSLLQIHRLSDYERSTSNQMPKKEDLQFGKKFSDHMLMIPYKGALGGWQPPQIVPFQDLKLSPAASCLHYGEILSFIFLIIFPVRYRASHFSVWFYWHILLDFPCTAVKYRSGMLWGCVKK